ncbi:MAG: hypothetical protein ACHREM_19310 [Polyangiales bacterium]
MTEPSNARGLEALLRATVAARRPQFIASITAITLMLTAAFAFLGWDLHDALGHGRSTIAQLIAAVTLAVATATFVVEIRRQRRLVDVVCEALLSDPKKIVWVHRYERGAFVFGVRLVTNVPVCFALADGRRLYVAAKTVTDTKRLLLEARDGLPNAVHGWSAERESRYLAAPSSIAAEV